MGKISFNDECLVPRRQTWLNYVGPDPIGFMRDFKTTLRFIFDVSTTRCRQKKLLWDYTGDPIRFYNEWWVKKELSRFSEMWVSLRTIGYVSKAKQDGNFSLELYGEIRNTFSPSNWLTKYMWLLYNYLFYNKVRESYTTLCRDYVFRFMNWCKDKYNLTTVTTDEAEIDDFRRDMSKEVPRGEGAYVGPEPGQESQEEGSPQPKPHAEGPHRPPEHGHAEGGEHRGHPGKEEHGHPHHEKKG